ncbi:hypothetical protein ACTXT7_001165 [Hymenolepis weldensis]
MHPPVASLMTSSHSFGALPGLLYAMGNLEYSDSQRQASRAVKILSMKYPQISSIIEEVMGRVLFDEFYVSPLSFILKP